MELGILGRQLLHIPAQAFQICSCTHTCAGTKMFLHTLTEISIPH